MLSAERWLEQLSSATTSPSCLRDAQTGRPQFRHGLLGCVTQSVSRDNAGSKNEGHSPLWIFCIVSYGIGGWTIVQGS